MYDFSHHEEKKGGKKGGGKKGHHHHDDKGKPNEFDVQYNLRNITPPNLIAFRLAS